MRGFKTANPAAIWAVFVALVIGFAIGQIWHGTGSATPAPAAAASPEACPPGATPAASPVPPPPAAVGQPVPYGDDWTVEVTGAAAAPEVLDFLPEGVFIVVNLTITNDSNMGRPFPFDDLVLVDDRGRFFVPDRGTSNAIPGTGGVFNTFQPNLPTDTTIVFDVAPDVGQSFTLESTANPNFRVRVDLELRG